MVCSIDPWVDGGVVKFPEHLGVRLGPENGWKRAQGHLGIVSGKVKLKNILAIWDSNAKLAEMNQDSLDVLLLSTNDDFFCFFKNKPSPLLINLIDILF